MDMAFTRSNFSTSSTIEFVSTNQSVDGGATTYNPPLVNSVRYSQKGDWLVAGLGDYSARILKISKKRGAGQSQGWVLRGHLGGVTQSSFVSPSDQEMLVVTASNDSTIKFWKLPTDTGEVVGSCTLSINHGEKINWMISSGFGSGARLFIADVSNDITWYQSVG
mmetsp:Transcript_13139/g.20231  ORF Transcript_13139/g.20231 Transcript_13139/m.20231 type:complete len:165 (-) Transcript_13139:567-1061(-)